MNPKILIVVFPFLLCSTAIMRIAGLAQGQAQTKESASSNETKGSADRLKGVEVEWALALLRERKLSTDDDSIIAYLAKLSDHDRDLVKVNQLVTDLGSDDFDRREAASRRLVELGPPALTFLRKGVQRDDKEAVRRANDCCEKVSRAYWPNVPSAAVAVLASRGAPAVADALIRYLPYCVDEMTEWQIYHSIESFGSNCRATELALDDPLPQRRCVAGCVLGRLGNEKQRQAVQKHLADPDPLVRLRCAQGLLAGRNAIAIETLIQLLAEPLPIAWQAEELLRWVAGEDAPSTVSLQSSLASRAECIQSWQRYWSSKNSQVDWENIANRGRTPGLLIVTGRRQTRLATLPPFDDLLRGLYQTCTDGEELPRTSACVWLYGLDGHKRGEWVYPCAGMDGKCSVLARRNLEELFIFAESGDSYSAARKFDISGEAISFDTVDVAALVQLQSMDPILLESRDDALRKSFASGSGGGLAPTPSETGKPRADRKVLGQTRLACEKTQVILYDHIHAATRIKEVVDDRRAVSEFYVPNIVDSADYCFPLVCFGFGEMRPVNYDAESLKTLLPQLKRGSAFTRACAASTIAENRLTTLAAIPTLFEQLADCDKTTAAFLVSEIARQGKPAVKQVLAALKDDNWRMRESAIQIVTLMHVSNPELISGSFELVRTCLRDPDRRVVGKAAEVMQFFRPQADQVIPELTDLFKRAAEDKQESSVFLDVGRALRNMKISNEDIERALEEGIKSKKRDTRLYAIHFFATWPGRRDDATRSAVLRVLRDEKDLDLQVETLNALACLRSVDNDTLAQVVGLLDCKPQHGRDRLLQLDALQTLSAWRNQAVGAVPTLIQVLEDRERDTTIRVAAIDAMRHVARYDERVVAALKRATIDRADAVARKATAVLGE